MSSSQEGRNGTSLPGRVPTCAAGSCRSRIASSTGPPLIGSRTSRHTRCQRPGGVQTYGVVVVTACMPSLRRMGALSSDASTCR